MRLVYLLYIIALLCGGQAIQVLKGKYGQFASPKFPQVYDNFLDVEWKIEVREGYRIKLRFTDFDLEDSYEEENGSCIYDYVLITEGDDVLKRFCGNDYLWPYNAPWPNEWIYSKSNVLTVKFISDYSNEGLSPTGFAAHYVEEDIDECAMMRQKELYLYEDWDKLVTCSHFCNNVPGSYYCSCRKGFQLHSNNHTCVATFCENRELRGDHGIIESPDYPRPYAKLSHCSWNILVRDGLSVHFRFDREFEIEEPVDNVCGYDILTLHYNGKADSYCGITAPNNGTVMDMNTRHVTVKFDTDLSLEMKGFRVIYNTTRIRCVEKPSNPSHGRIVSSNPKYYEFEDVVNYTCNQGYDLIGSSRLECLSNGKWDRPEPTCKIKSCGEPEELFAVKYSSILNIETKRFIYSETVTVKCNDWYELKTAGTDTWRCEDSKLWERADNSGDRTLPICVPKCGIKGPEDKSKLVAHIFGGTRTLKHEWPWMAFLNFGYKNLKASNRAFCGGSIISADYVLTAAHCVTKWLPNQTHVWLGVHNRYDKNATVKYVQPEAIIIHPNHHKDTPWDYDVALIRLGETIIMNEAIRPVCLPSSEEDYNMVTRYAEGEVAGWGHISLHFTAKSLKHVKYPLVNRATCINAFQEVNSKIIFTERMFCAGTDGGTQSTCGGDSGGPLVLKKNETSKYYEVGLVSHGWKDCGKRIFYTTYAKMTKEIVSWIRRIANIPV